MYHKQQQQKQTAMNKFLTAQREALMQEIRIANTQCTYTRNEVEAAEAINDMESVKFWNDKCMSICEDVKQLWGALDAMDSFLETIED